MTSNSLVLIQPASSSHDPLSTPEAVAAFLVSPQIITLTIGTPESVPVGRYAKTSLTSMGLWDKLTPKYIFAANVRQALDYVSRGEVDAGIVYSTDAARPKSPIAAASEKKAKVAIIATLTGHKPISYPIATTTASANLEAAQRFVDYVLSQEGQAVLKKYGFGSPK